MSKPLRSDRELIESCKRQYLRAKGEHGGTQAELLEFLAQQLPSEVIEAYKDQSWHAYVARVWRNAPKVAKAPDGRQITLPGFEHIDGELSYYGDDEHTDQNVRKLDTYFANVVHFKQDYQIAQKKVDEQQARANVKRARWAAAKELVGDPTGLLQKHWVYVDADEE